jgi:hypothetical protein
MGPAPQLFLPFYYIYFVVAKITLPSGLIQAPISFFFQALSDGLTFS